MEKTFNTSEKISLADAISLLGVSSATIRNWIRHNYLRPENEGKTMTFAYSEVKDLKDRINSGEIDRLNKRANKRNSGNTFVPDEYAGKEDVVYFIQNVINHYHQLLDRNVFLLAVILNVLKKNDLVSISSFDPKSISSKNKNVQKELDWWFEKTNKVGLDNYIELINLKLPQVSDVLGLVYQSITAEGNKAQAGSYYTPKDIVDEIVSEYVNEKSTVLDPCCGTGQFLLSASDKTNDPENIWGFDIDETAVRLARINLITKFPNLDFEPHIYLKNSLLDIGSLFDKTPEFDAVITNPPWGVHFSNSDISQLQSIFPQIKSKESFSYFLIKGLGLLKKGGVVSFILPEAVLNVKAHADLRSELLKHTRIKKIKSLGRSFKNVFTPVIRIDLIKDLPDEKTEIEIETQKTKHKTKQSRLLNNPDYVFDVFNDESDLGIIKKLYESDHYTLKDRADWALGIVTGDNKKYLLDQKVKDAEPILTGKEIKKFTFSRPKKYIQFTSNKFQQVAPEGRYRAKEKLLYKFISKNLVFSYDDKGTLTLNSANVLIPKLDYPTKTILALFNSSLYQFAYQKKFNSIKVLKGNIERLPLPKLSQDQHKKIEKSVRLLLDSTLDEKERKTEYINLDNTIMDIFSLSNTEKEYIKSKIKVSEKLLN